MGPPRQPVPFRHTIWLCGPAPRAESVFIMAEVSDTRWHWKLLRQETGVATARQEEIGFPAYVEMKASLVLDGS